MPATAARGLRFTIQQHIPIKYKEVVLAASHRVDLIVEDLIVVEVKAVAALVPVNLAQALT